MILSCGVWGLCPCLVSHHGCYMVPWEKSRGSHAHSSVVWGLGPWQHRGFYYGGMAARTDLWG